MGNTLMQVRFPDGTVKFGTYQNTADIGSPFLVDDIDDWNSDRSHFIDLPSHGEIVDVEVAIDYGGGTRGTMKARGGHLTEHAYYVTQCGGWGKDLSPTMQDVQDGLPDWWNHD